MLTDAELREGLRALKRIADALEKKNLEEKEAIIKQLTSELNEFRSGRRIAAGKFGSADSLLYNECKGVTIRE